MLNLIAGVLCLVEAAFFTFTGGPLWIVLAAAFVGGLNLSIWEYNR